MARLIYIVLLSSTLVTTAAFAQEQEAEQEPGPDLDPGRFAERFQGLPLGGDLPTLVQHVEGVTRKLFAQRISETPDAHLRDRLTAEIEVAVQAVRDSHIEFKGQKTGYNVSVVASDFAHRTEESMLVAAVGREHDYFFFMQGALWKLVTTRAAGLGFPVFLVNLTQLYGAPATIQYKNPDEQSGPYLARWTNAEVVLEVQDRPDYNTITLRWARRVVHDRADELRGGVKPPAESAESDLDPTILDIMRD